MLFTSMKNSLVRKIRDAFAKKNPEVAFDDYSAGAGLAAPSWSKLGTSEPSTSTPGSSSTGRTARSVAMSRERKSTFRVLARKPGPRWGSVPTGRSPSSHSLSALELHDELHAPIGLPPLGRIVAGHRQGRAVAHRGERSRRASWPCSGPRRFSAGWTGCATSAATPWRPRCSSPPRSRPQPLRRSWSAAPRRGRGGRGAPGRVARAAPGRAPRPSAPRLRRRSGSDPLGGCYVNHPPTNPLDPGEDAFT
jgi:hypothetical protein